MPPVAKVLLIVVSVVLGLAGICFIGLSALFGNPITRPRYPAYEALMAAVDKHDAKQVRQLLAQGTDPNKFPDDPDSIQAEDDSSVLNCAVDEGNEDIVKALLDYHADPNQGDGWHDSPLAAAAAKNNLPMMRLLI
jgi:ankyrin repeat protein